MKENKEKKIAAILNSLDGMEKAFPRDGLFEQIEAQLVESVAIISIKTIRWVVAAASLLLLLNIAVLYQFQNRTGLQKVNVEEIQFSFLVNNYNIY